MYSAWLAPLAVAFNSVVWGLSWLPLQILQERGLHPLWSTALMYSVPVVGLLLWRRSAPLRPFAHHRDLWVLLVCAGLTTLCFNWAVTIGDVIRVVLLFYLMPVWTVFLAWWLLDERPTAGAMLRVAMALIGVSLVMKPAGNAWYQLQVPWPSSMADALAILGGFFFAATNVMLNRTSRIAPEARVFAMFIGGVVLCSAMAQVGVQTGTLGVTALPDFAWGWLGLALLFSLGFIASNLALQYGSARVPAHTMSLIMLLEVVAATVSSALLGAAELGWQVAIGGSLVMAGALMAVLSSRH